LCRKKQEEETRSKKTGSKGEEKENKE